MRHCRRIPPRNSLSNSGINLLKKSWGVLLQKPRRNSYWENRHFSEKILYVSPARNTGKIPTETKKNPGRNHGNNPAIKIKSRPRKFSGKNFCKGSRENPKRNFRNILKATSERILREFLGAVPGIPLEETRDVFLQKYRKNSDRNYERNFGNNSQNFGKDFQKIPRGTLEVDPGKPSEETPVQILR